MRNAWGAWILVGGVTLGGVVACGEGDGGADAAVGADAATGTDAATGGDAAAATDAGGAPTLTSAHPGWQQKDCFAAGCHSFGDLPTHHEAAWEAPDCAGCHGGNGACEPPGNHSRSMSCTSCHGSSHGFSASDACTSCHFAAAGLTACH